jgi:hypothetical protein
MDKLLREMGLRHYGLFAVTTEGKPLPDGSESASGYVLDAQGRVFSFWLDWDDDQRRIAFTEFKRVEAEPDWEDDQEFQEARQAAGLE